MSEDGQEPYKRLSHDELLRQIEKDFEDQKLAETITIALVWANDRGVSLDGLGQFRFGPINKK